jgi:hypothetical protein
MTNRKIQRFKARWFPGSYSSGLLIYISLLGFIILLLTTKGITDEGTISLQGDMPRYLMNGVYFLDFLKDWPLTHPLTYTYEYYARYPALSLGHHPVLVSAAEVPFYSLWGISVFSARMTIIAFLLLGTIAWFLLIRSIYDETTAFFSSLIFITLPYIVRYSRIVLSEIPALALILVTTYFFYRYIQSDKNKYAFAFAISFAVSLYAKQTAMFLFPVFLCYFCLTKGIKKLLTKEIILSCTIMALLIAPLIPITLKFSQTNVQWMIPSDMGSRFTWSYLLRYLRDIINSQLTLPVSILGFTSLGILLYRKDKRVNFFVLWVVFYYIQITYTGVEGSRYAIYWIPVFCLFAALTRHFFSSHRWKTLISISLFAIIGYQFVAAFMLEPEYAKGYEEAAQYVVQNRKGESILYTANIDTGFFVFFVRKHNPNPNSIILLADKILATSRLKHIVKDHIEKREQIYDMLQDFGVGYVVIEDQPFRFPVLEWLREEVRSDQFILRKRIPVHSNNAMLQGVALYIYEYKGYIPPLPGKKLRINIPLMGDSIEISFDHLYHKKSPADTKYMPH